MTKEFTFINPKQNSQGSQKPQQMSFDKLLKKEIDRFFVMNPLQCKQQK